MLFHLYFMYFSHKMVLAYQLDVFFILLIYPFQGIKAKVSAA